MNTVVYPHGITDLEIHVDGPCPLKDSTQKLWLSLGPSGRPRSSAFLVGLSGGNSKPINVYEFRGHRVNNINSILRNGMRLRASGRTFQVILHSFVADAFVRAFLKQVK